MRKPQLFTTLLALTFVASSPLAAQNLNGCRVDMSELSRTVSVDEREMQPGTSLQLAESYMQKLDARAYGEFPSDVRYFIYVRPASRKEIRKNKVSGNSHEVVSTDGNIYLDIPVPPGLHFFELSEVFEGDYRPEWQKQTLVLPLGVVPTDVGTLQGKPIHILSREADYLLLESEGKKIVFYRGFPPLGDVFETPATLASLELKRQKAEALIGRRMVMLKEAPISDINLERPDTWAWTGSQKNLTWMTEVVSVGRKSVQVNLSTAPLPIEIDTEAPYIWYDSECVSTKQIAYLDSVREDAAKQEMQMAALTMVEDSYWAENKNLDSQLQARFIPAYHTDKQQVYQQGLIPPQPEKPYLFAQVDDQGKSWLVSHYASDQGLFHTQIRVFIGRDSLQTNRISTADQRNRRQYRGSTVIEEVAFTHEADQKILEAIAKAGDEPVYVKFIAGGDFAEKIRLSEGYRSAIRDTWLWGKMLTAKHNGD